MGSELPSVIRPFPPAVPTASNPHRKGMAFPCRWLIPAVVDGNRCESPGSATVRRSRGIRCCPDGATPTCHPERRGARVRGPACRGPCGLRRQSGPRIEAGATIGGPGRQCGPMIAAMSLNSKPLESDPPRQPPVEPPHKAPRRTSPTPCQNRQGAIGGAILGRRDRTARPPRVEHYSAAVDTRPWQTARKHASSVSAPSAPGTVRPVPDATRGRARTCRSRRRPFPCSSQARRSEIPWAAGGHEQVMLENRDGRRQRYTRYGTQPIAIR